MWWALSLYHPLAVVQNFAEPFFLNAAEVYWKVMFPVPAIREFHTSRGCWVHGPWGPTLIRSCQMICHPHPLEKSFSHVAGTETPGQICIQTQKNWMEGRANHVYRWYIWVPPRSAKSKVLFWVMKWQEWKVTSASWGMRNLLIVIACVDL